jgi:GTPase SAR1 family protein
MGFLLVFDLTNETSFLNVRNWIGEIQSNAYSENVDMILVGNKCDLEKERIISRSRAVEFAGQCQIGYIETSALENFNVAKSIELLLNSVMNHIENDGDFSQSNSNVPTSINPDECSPKKPDLSYCCNY